MVVSYLNKFLLFFVIPVAQNFLPMGPLKNYFLMEPVLMPIVLQRSKPVQNFLLVDSLIVLQRAQNFENETLYIHFHYHLRNLKIRILHHLQFFAKKKKKKLILNLNFKIIYKKLQNLLNSVEVFFLSLFLRFLCVDYWDSTLLGRHQWRMSFVSAKR